MTKNERIVGSTIQGLNDRAARRGSRTDWAKVDSITDEELDALIAADPDDDMSPIDMTRVIAGVPPLDYAPVQVAPLDPDVRAALPADGEAMARAVNDILRAHFRARAPADAA